MAYERELAAVQRWMDAAGRAALSHFRIGVPSEAKADGTPVTAADREVEAALRQSIAAEFPADGVLGEEQGESGSATRRWIIDPIDGTKNFSRGIPIFATLVALQDQGRTVLGIVNAPALGTRWWAVRGKGAFRDGERIRVTKTSEVAEADLCTGGLGYAGRARDEQVLNLTARARRQRGFGDFWGHVLVAQGSMDAMVEFAALAPWDVAAPKIIVEEAGGRWSDLDGEDRTTSGPCVSSNGTVHEAILAALRE